MYTSAHYQTKFNIITQVVCGLTFVPIHTTFFLINCRKTNQPTLLKNNTKNKLVSDRTEIAGMPQPHQTLHPDVFVHTFKQSVGKIKKYALKWKP